MKIVLVVDEAGMVGTRQLAQVSDLVHNAHGKLILIGDHHQLPELEAGGLFRALAARLPAVVLTDNMRQRDEWERAALNELRSGSVTRALAMYRNRGRIITAPTPAAAIQNTVDQWEQDVARLGDISQVLLIAHENSTVESLNKLAREALSNSDTLQGPATVVAGHEYQAGDRVVCLKNRPRLGVLNGDLATITSVDPNTQTLRIRLDRNHESRTLPTWYLSDGHLDYGYAITGHKAQGATAEIAHAITTGSTDREWVYVTLSRGRQANTLHVVEPDNPEECTHLTHARPGKLRALTTELERQGAQVAAIDSLSR
jgi:ATP-dependent exoDNAse (exonuclease V) alpha subunit